MRKLTDIFIKSLDLLEAEGRLLRGNTMRVIAAAVAFAVLGMLALVGVVLLILSLYWRLDSDYGPITAALVTGIVHLVVAALGFAVVWIWVQKRSG